MGFRFAILAGLMALPAAAQAQAPTPTPDPLMPKVLVDDPLAPDNLLSGYVLPLIVVNVVGVEYERVVHPALGGIAVRGHLDYIFLGVFDLLGTGIGGHWVYYVPVNIQLDPKMPSGPPAGPFLGAGIDLTLWRGRYFGPGSYDAKISGVSFEPNVYAGYRVIAQHFFIAPRAGFGFAFGGAKYKDSAGNREYYSRGRDFELHFDLVLGVCW